MEYFDWQDTDVVFALEQFLMEEEQEELDWAWKPSGWKFQKEESAA
jgi:hypothetical protein